jgi:hypothetical protein
MLYNRKPVHCICKTFWAEPLKILSWMNALLIPQWHKIASQTTFNLTTLLEPQYKKIKKKSMQTNGPKGKMRTGLNDPCMQGISLTTILKIWTHCTIYHNTINNTQKSSQARKSMCKASTSQKLYSAPI